MKQTPENEWLAQYRAGDVSALGKLVEFYRRPLFGFILKMTEGHGDAEEVFQEVWFRAIRKLDTYKPKSFLSWLFRIAHNLIIDQARKQKPAVSLQEKQQEGDLSLEERIEAPERGPATNFGGLDLGRRIDEAVQALPEEQREVFLMRTKVNLPFKEIAKIQGTSINTALARMQYALEKLRTSLKDEYEELAKS